MKACFPIEAESLNCGLIVAAIEKCNNMISVLRGSGKTQQVFGTELKTLIDELNGVLVA